MRPVLALVPAAAAVLLAACTAPRVAPPSAPTVVQTPAPLPAPPSAGPAAATPAAVAGVEGPVRGARAYAWTPRMDQAAQRLRGGLSGPAEVDVTTDQRIWVRLPGAGSFARGRAALEPAARGWLDQVALALRAHPGAEAQIVASGDAGQRGPAAESLALDRAASARDWLVARGIPAPRLSVAGLAARSAAVAEPRVDVLIGERAEAR